MTGVANIIIPNRIPVKIAALFIDSSLPDNFSFFSQKANAQMSYFIASFRQIRNFYHNLIDSSFDAIGILVEIFSHLTKKEPSKRWLFC
jgi:hypothetical protein